MSKTIDVVDEQIYRLCDVPFRIPHSASENSPHSKTSHSNRDAERGEQLSLDFDGAGAIYIS